VVERHLRRETGWRAFRCHICSYLPEIVMRPMLDAVALRFSSSWLTPGIRRGEQRERGTSGRCSPSPGCPCWAQVRVPDIALPPRACATRSRPPWSGSWGVSIPCSSRVLAPLRARSLTASPAGRARGNTGPPSRYSMAPRRCAGWRHARHGSSVRDGCSRRSRSSRRR
jgi:hypothetical protein